MCSAINMFSSDSNDSNSSSKETNLSPPMLKRLFYIWFNSISNDGKSLNTTQFSIIINRIFSSTSTLSQSQILQIFNQLSNNSDTIYYNEFLSKNDDIFINMMVKLLASNSAALSILQSVPNLCVNNASNNTLQEILSDQSNQISMLTEWILEIGLPSNTSNNNLHEKLNDIMHKKKRLSLELELLSQEKHNLETDQDTLTRSVSDLNENYTYCVQQIAVLKSLNKEYKLLNEKLQSSYDAVQKDLFNQQQRSKQDDDIIGNLNKLNQQYKTTIQQLMVKDDRQSKKIMNLSTINQQVEVAMESAVMVLEQKTEQVNELQHRLEILQSTNFHHDDERPPDLDETLRFAMTDLAVDRTRLNLEGFHLNPSTSSSTNIGGHGKSYLFTMSTRTVDHDPLSESESPNSSANGRSRRQSALLIGGGHPMSLKTTPLNVDSSYMKLYHDEKHGVDVYVSNDEHDVGSISETSNDDSDVKLKIQLETEENRKDIDTNALPTLQPLKESISIEYKTNDAYHGYENEEDNMSVMDTKTSEIIRRINEKEKKSQKIPRGFNEQQNNTSCVIFGWNLW